MRSEETELLAKSLHEKFERLSCFELLHCEAAQWKYWLVTLKSHKILCRHVPSKPGQSCLLLRSILIKWNMSFGVEFKFFCDKCRASKVEQKMLVCQVVFGVRSSTRTWEDGGVFVWMGQKVAGIVCASQRPSSPVHSSANPAWSLHWIRVWKHLTANYTMVLPPRWPRGVFVWSFLAHNINFGCCLFGKQQQTELEHKKVKKIFIQAPWQYPVIKSTIVNETTKSQTCSTLHNWELESQRDC